jgi:hypothetical protein
MSEQQPPGEILDSRNLQPAELSATSSTDELGAAAAAELTALLIDERAVAVRYWHLGRLLTWARKPLTHGQWGRFLQQWKIDKSRAAKALRIFRAFTTPEAIAELTVAEAYERSAKPSRKKAKSRKQKPAPSTGENPPPETIQSWTKFTEAMTGIVEKQLEEPEFLSPEEAGAALAALGRLLAALHDCEARLRRRAEPATE